jgi:hypothetical protein
MKLFMAAQDMGSEGDLPKALEALDNIERLLDGTGATSARPMPPQEPAVAAAPAEPPVPLADRLEADYMRRVTALEPRVEDARKTRAGDAKWMKLFMAAQDLASEGDFAKAMEALDNIERLLDAKAVSAGEQPAGKAADQEPDPQEARWLERRQAIQDQYLMGLREHPGDAGQLRAVLAFAEGKAEAGDFAKALQGIERLETLLQAQTTTRGPEGAALKSWQTACAEVKNQLRKLQAKLLEGKFANSANAVLRVESIVKSLAKPPSTQQEVIELEKWIGADDIISRVQERNPWGIQVRIRDRLLPVLAALKPQLPS